MNELRGFFFVIERTGAPAFLDPDETIAFRRAEGFYVAPNRAQATVRIIAPGFVTEVEVISIDQTQWETNILTAHWQELPPNWGFNPAVLFDPHIGIQSILASDLSELNLDGLERLEGREGHFYALSGRLEGAKIFEMSYQLIGPETMTARLWVAPETFELHRAVISDPGRIIDGEATIWQVDFSRFGEVVDIVPPVQVVD